MARSSGLLSGVVAGDWRVVIADSVSVVMQWPLRFCGFCRDFPLFVKTEQNFGRIFSAGIVFSLHRG